MSNNFMLAPGESFVRCPYNVSHEVTNARLARHLSKCRAAYLKSLITEEDKKYAYRTCRHNALHHVPLPEIKLHEETCRDAHSVVSFASFHNSDEGRKHYEERRKQDKEFSIKREKRSPSPSSSRDDRKRKAYDEHHDRDRDRRSNHSRDRERKRNRDGDSREQHRASETNDWPLEEEDWEAESSGYNAGYDPKVKLEKEVIIYNPSGLTKSERKKFREEMREKAVKKASGEENGESSNASNPPDFRDWGNFDESDPASPVELKESGPSMASIHSRNIQPSTSSCSSSTRPSSSSSSSSKRYRDCEGSRSANVALGMIRVTGGGVLALIQIRMIIQELTYTLKNNN